MTKGAFGHNACDTGLYDTTGLYVIRDGMPITPRQSFHTVFLTDGKKNYSGRK